MTLKIDFIKIYMNTQIFHFKSMTLKIDFDKKLYEYASILFK